MRFTHTQSGKIGWVVWGPIKQLGKLDGLGICALQLFWIAHPPTNTHKCKCSINHSNSKRIPPFLVSDSFIVSHRFIIVQTSTMSPPAKKMKQSKINFTNGAFSSLSQVESRSSSSSSNIPSCFSSPSRCESLFVPAVLSSTSASNNLEPIYIPDNSDKSIRSMNPHSSSENDTKCYLPCCYSICDPFNCEKLQIPKKDTARIYGSGEKPHISNSTSIFLIPPHYWSNE